MSPRPSTFPSKLQRDESQADESQADELLLANFVPAEDDCHQRVESPATAQTPSRNLFLDALWRVASLFCASFLCALKAVAASLARMIMLRPAAWAVAVLLLGLSAAATRHIHPSGIIAPDEALGTLAPTLHPATQPVRIRRVLLSIHHFLNQNMLLVLFRCDIQRLGGKNNSKHNGSRHQLHS